MERVLNVLIISFVNGDESVEAISHTEYFKELVLDVFGEPGNEEFRVLIELNHVFLVKRRAFVLLERVFIAALLATHLAVELVLAQLLLHYIIIIIMIDDKFIFDAKPLTTTKKIKTHKVDFAL